MRRFFLYASVCLGVSSCVMDKPRGFIPAPSSTEYLGSYPEGQIIVNASSDWVDATYDPSGLPIYGYSYGRPVYGYTPNGVAIYTIGAIRNGYYVPPRHPASWYRGTWRYPSRVHKRSISMKHFKRGNQGKDKRH